MEHTRNSFITSNTLLGIDLFKNEILSSFILVIRSTSELIFDVEMIPKEVTVIQEACLNGISDDIERIIMEKLHGNDVYLIDFSFFTTQNELIDYEVADIYLITDEFHTPGYLVNHFEAFFKRKGFSTQIRSSGSKMNIPNENYQKNQDLRYLIIQGNPRIYLNKTNSKIDSKKRIELSKIIQDFFVEF